jgi:hypothetical protein
MNYAEMTTADLFTQMLLQIFKKPGEDIMVRTSSSPLSPFELHMYDLFSNLNPNVEADDVKRNVKRNVLVQLVNLIDQYGLSILGYILLKDKHNALHNLYSFVQYDEELKKHIAFTLNHELVSVLDYYPPDSSISGLIEKLKTIKRYVPSFELSVENANLIGYRLARHAFKGTFALSDPSRQFEVPDKFVPYSASPRGGSRTRKNHKRHKKQNAKKRFTKKHNK